MPHGEGSGSANAGKTEGVPVVKPGMTSGEIGGLKRTDKAKEMPRSGDKPKKGE